MEKLDDVINYIMNSDDYKKCIIIKNKMKDNKYLVELIDKVKRLQKEYIKTNNKDIKCELDSCIEELNSIPIYNIYLEKLGKVNDMISYVIDELNDYFYKVVN